jgi:DNA adenine methylase
MKQLSLPGLSTPKIVNVASVTHRSPFRYPGGKTWLVPRIRAWLHSMDMKPSTFIEPFAGGAVVGLSVAFEELACRVILAELDEQVAAVWQTIVEEGDGPWLADQIVSFALTPKNVDALLSKTNVSLRMRAFQTVVKNRVNRGGILAEGAGKLKYGENGRGISSRWYPETLAQRINDINEIKSRLSFIHGDGLQLIQEYSKMSDVVFFLDPPYTASSKRPGARLYNYCELDHEKLFALLATITGNFLITYDNADEVKELAHQYNFDYEAVPMKSTHHAELSELLIGKNLDWART